MSPLITIDKLNFGYKNQIVFKDADLVIYEKNITGLIGPNGSGKSTLFKIILENLESKSGSVVSRLSKNVVGMMSQEFSMPSLLTVEEACSLILYLNNSAYSDLSYLVENWTRKEKEKFKKIKLKRCSSCSMGERKWVYLRLLLSIDKFLYFLDEPTSGVDPEYRFEIWNLIKDEIKKGRSIVVSSHLLDEVADNCDEIILIKDCRLESYSSKNEISDKYNSKSLDEAFINAYSK